MTLADCVEPAALTSDRQFGERVAYVARFHLLKYCYHQGNEMYFIFWVKFRLCQSPHYTEQNGRIHWKGSGRDLFEIIS
jgi:hypothetical protein